MSATQIFPPLDAATEAALRESIQRFGVIVPVVKDQHGNILDGHNRVRIATELDLLIPQRVRTVADEDEAQEVARTLNQDRRHLTVEQRRAIVAELRKEGHSQYAIAKAHGITRSTVQKDLRNLQVDTRYPPENGAPDRAAGLDGKTYPTKRQDLYKRRARVLQLREQGNTMERIAKELGVSIGAIANDLKRAGDPLGKYRPGKRINPDSPYEITTDGQRTRAEKQKSRISIALAETSEHCKGLSTLDFGMVMAVCSHEEMRQWATVAKTAAGQLGRLSQRLREASR